MEDYQFNYKPELSELNSGLESDSLVEEVRKSASEGCALYYDVWSINRDVAMRLKAIRKSKGLTLKEVSKISGVPEVTLGNVERLKGISLSELSRRTGYSEISLKKALSGDTDFSERMLTSVASALGCNVMLTLGGK